MVHSILSQYSAGITELKRNPMKTVEDAQGEAVAILNRNAPAFYCVPAEMYEQMLERLEDIELNAIADSRENGVTVPVILDEL